LAGQYCKSNDISHECRIKLWQFQWKRQKGIGSVLALGIGGIPKPGFSQKSPPGPVFVIWSDVFFVLPNLAPRTIFWTGFFGFIRGKVRIPNLVRRKKRLTKNNEIGPPCQKRAKPGFGIDPLFQKKHAHASQPGQPATKGNGHNLSTIFETGLFG
jgi:hypothetical protein